MRSEKRLQKKLDKAFDGAVHAAYEDGLIRLTGTLPSWDQILKACRMAVSGDRTVHVVNDLVLAGAEPVPVRTPSLSDNALDGETPDVLIIGGGISGCTIARELSRYDLRILLVDKEADFALQASGRNDGEVHVGVDLSKGSLKQKYVLLGNRMYGDLCDELEVPFRRTGQVAAFTQVPLAPVIFLYVQWRRFHDGCTDARFRGKKWLEQNVPELDASARFAMVNELAGLVSPYELTIACAENAVQNGAKMSLNTCVSGMKTEDGRITEVVTNRGTIRPKVVINAAGVFADDVAELAGDRFYSIHPRRGTDIIQDVKSGHIVNKIDSIMTVNKALLTSHTKGGGIMPTVHGNVLLGPDAVECREKEDYATYPESIRNVYEKQKRTVPKADTKDIITYFTGVRAPTFEEDFVLEWGRKCRNLYHVGGIQSPGLTSAPAFAKDVADAVVARLSESRPVNPNPDFDPHRRGIPHLRDMRPEERAAKIAENPDYGVIICRCEEISKGEILDALNSPLCPPTVDAVKKRVRPGMGRCQGGFCSPLVVRIIAEHEGIPLEQVRKSSAESVLLFGPSKGGVPHDED